MLGVVFCVERANTKTHVIKILYYESAHELYHWAIYEAWLWAPDASMNTHVTDALGKCISLYHMKQFTQVGLQ